MNRAPTVSGPLTVRPVLARAGSGASVWVGLLPASPSWPGGLAVVAATGAVVVVVGVAVVVVTGAGFDRGRLGGRHRQHLGRQRGVAQRRGLALTVAEGVVQEGDQVLAFLASIFVGTSR